MKIGTRLTIGFLAITALIWVTFFLAVNTYTKVGQQFEILKVDVHPTLITLSDIGLGVSEVSHQSREYIASGEEETKQIILSTIKQLKNEGLMHLEQHIPLGPEEKRASEELVAKIDTFSLAVVELINLIEQGVSYDQILEVDRKADSLAFVLIKQLEERKTIDREKLAAAEEAVTEAHTSGMKILLLTAGIVTLLAAAIALFITRSIVYPLRTLHEGAEVIRQGNLDYKVGTEAKDEIGQLSRAFDLMTEDLRDTTTSIDNLNKEIAERKWAEELYRTLIESSPIGIYIVQDGKFRLVNLQFQKYTGFSEDELLGMDPLELVHPEDRERVRENAVQMLKGNLISPYEYRINHHSGEIHWTMETVVSIFYSGKRATLGNFMDITERKRMEHDLGERVKELNCLYGIASIAERPGITLDELYQEVANLLPPSWQYPEITCARITFGDEEFRTDNFKTAEWLQSANINVRGQKKGTVEVTYLEERPEIDEGPFMKEERLLINAVAERLGEITERKQAEEKLW